ncbi:unnamed protein product [Bursaphelenchus okinawaensis]|uniref:Uncharacterized protein n=1 Tax=Bursaphelenchus okinawaensis TaxID=465554 RepID=A0A811K5L7_9BILA|nr:unnamed protein product [Bursaphelenchus okinawaensis]CAG9093066.1 unnamed protein product [Bursaphelenchus okinawaensis]
MKRRNREGVFNNAIYSKIVRAAEETDVLLGVEEDLDFITKRNPYDNSKVWNNAPGSASDVSIAPLPPIRQPGRGLGNLRQHGDFCVAKTIKPHEKRAAVIVSDDELEESPMRIIRESGSKYKCDITDDSVIAGNLSVRSYKQKKEDTIFKKPYVPEKKHRNRFNEKDKGDSIFNPLVEKSDSDLRQKLKSVITTKNSNVDNISVDEIAAQVSEYVPKLPLRVGHTMCYSGVVSEMCKKSLDGDNMSSHGSKERINTLNETMFRAAKAFSEYMKKTDTVCTNATMNFESPLVYTSPKSTQSLKMNSVSMLSQEVISLCDGFSTGRNWQSIDFKQLFFTVYSNIF